MPKTATAIAHEPLLDEADHVPVRAFRLRLASFSKGKRVVLVGGNRAPVGLFIPLHVTSWAGHAEILTAARRSLRNVQTIARYTSEKDAIA